MFAGAELDGTCRASEPQTNSSDATAKEDKAKRLVQAARNKEAKWTQRTLASTCLLPCLRCFELVPSLRGTAVYNYNTGNVRVSLRPLLQFISVINQLDAQNVFHSKFYFVPLLVSSTCAHHQEVKIALHSLWYHHIYTCDDTRGCVMQF